MSVNENDLGILAVCSVRYALGKQTCIVYDICEMVTRNWGRFSESVMETIKRDIRNDIYCGIVSKDDAKQWSKLLEL